SVMGDSQFGLHGATAIGWMTLEGTKSAGTDLHSKTASILSISRDSAKVFNYSRIYGAGKKHAVQLLLQGDSTLTKEKAAKRADRLYEATKGSRAFRSKSQSPAAVSSLWYGGSESFLFNTLEAIALSDRPTTPALGCGVTRALRKTYLEDASSYLPSRINWVVQSSGVDYLHLLIVSMEYLISKYDIKARYLLSVHDEVRYLAEEGDRYRTALALQVANAGAGHAVVDVPALVGEFDGMVVDVAEEESLNEIVPLPEPDGDLVARDALGPPLFAFVRDTQEDPMAFISPADESNAHLPEIGAAAAVAVSAVTRLVRGGDNTLSVNVNATSSSFFSDAASADPAEVDPVSTDPTVPSAGLEEASRME
ncbi:MAG: hypothetical protein EOO38_17005, partial [Cytophagaceae bacterium]